MVRPGACIGTGLSHDPIPKALCWAGQGQEYQLLLQPVVKPHISTGCNSNVYFWPGSLARFLVVCQGQGFSMDSSWGSPLAVQAFFYYMEQTTLSFSSRICYAKQLNIIFYLTFCTKLR
jgi:hypothetical protein